MTDHLSRFEDEAMCKLGEKVELDDAFRDEHVLIGSQDMIPWISYFVNNLESDFVLSDLTFHQRKKLMHSVKKFFWHEPYLYRNCANRIIRCCVPEV